MRLQLELFFHERPTDGRQSCEFAVAPVDDAGHCSVMHPCRLGQSRGREVEQRDARLQLTWCYQSVHISTANVIWCVVSSLHIDVFQNVLPSHRTLRAYPQGPSAMTSIDARTLAFREWIAAILAKKKVSRTELARRAGLSHSTLSRATTDDNYRINFRADTIAKLTEFGGILPPAAIATAGSTGEPQDNYSEPEATPWQGEPLRQLSPSQSIWTVHSQGLSAMGLMPGDRFILDQSVQPQTRDIVMIQAFDNQTGAAETLLRVYADGFAVTPLYLVDGSRRLWIDGKNVSVMGVIVESWRGRTAA